MSQIGKFGRSIKCRNYGDQEGRGAYATGILDWEPPSRFAISFWMQWRYYSNMNNSARGVISFGTFPPYTQDWRGNSRSIINTGYGRDSGHKKLYFSNMGGVNCYTPEVLDINGGWNFVVLNFNGAYSPITVYINNVSRTLTGTTIPTSSFIPYSNRINIGIHSTAIPEWDILTGSIDQLIFWDEPLSESSINEMWNQT
jgi:hypothetical protein